MKCVAVSDFHLRDVETPPADLLLVGGDMTMIGASHELDWFTEWLKRQPQKHKVWIAGNHEISIERFPDLAKDIARQTNTIYLNDELVEIEGVKIWGSPITPWFCDWAFNRRRGMEIRQHWNKIPEDLDILITHGPPHGFLDLIESGEAVGCEELYDVIAHKLAKPPGFHIFGHIHSGHGRAQLRT